MLAAGGERVIHRRVLWEKKVVRGTIVWVVMRLVEIRGTWT